MKQVDEMPTSGQFVVVFISSVLGGVHSSTYRWHGGDLFIYDSSDESASDWEIVDADEEMAAFDELGSDALFFINNKIMQ